VTRRRQTVLVPEEEAIDTLKRVERFLRKLARTSKDEEQKNEAILLRRKCLIVIVLMGER